jgi:histidine triad (HIT) family protein
MSECVFCQIIQKQLPANVVYEDEQVVAFLSNHPVNEGHTLVVPKKHCTNIYEISEEETAYLFKIVKRVALAVRDSVAAEGIRIVQNNGEAAGQVIFHLHVHVIPMKPLEGFSHGRAYRSPSNSRNVDELEMDAQKIRNFFSELSEK